MSASSTATERFVNCFQSSSSQILEENSDAPLVLLTNIMFDHPQYHTPSDVDTIVTGNLLDHPQMLWRIKESPASCRENLRIDNIEVVKREVMDLLEEIPRSSSQSSSQSKRTVYLIDVSDTENIASLHSLSKLLPSSFHIVYSSKSVPSSIASDHLPESVSSRLQAQLMAGEAVPGPAGASISVRSGCLKYQVGSPFLFNAPFIDADRARLTALCAVQRDVRARYTLCHAPLLVIGCGPFFTHHAQVLTHLRDSGGSLSQVLLNQLVLSPTWLPYYESLLREFPEPSLCIDCFTHQAVFGMSLPCGSSAAEPVSRPRSGVSVGINAGTRHWGSDEEVLCCVLYLCRRGFGARLCLSVDIKTRLQLRWYGGPGVGYVTDSLLPRLRRWYDLSVLESVVGTEALHQVVLGQNSSSSTTSGTINSSESSNFAGSSASSTPLCFREEEVRALLGGNLLALLSWYHPPDAVELPVETLPCHICGREFVPGDHYSKFSFVYCSSACLAKHRKLDYK